MPKDDKVTPMRPTVEESVTIEPVETRVEFAPGRAFLEMLQSAGKDIVENRGGKTDNDHQFLMARFFVDEDRHFGQIFIKSVSVANGPEGHYLMVIEPMTAAEYNKLMADDTQNVEVLTYDGLISILEQIDQDVNLDNVQVLVRIDPQIPMKLTVAGELTIDDDHLQIAIPQGLVYQPEDGEKPAVLCIQL